MGFDPTGQFPGNPSGGGNAPVTGMPSTLLDFALGGNPFRWKNQDDAGANNIDPVGGFPFGGGSPGGGGSSGQLGGYAGAPWFDYWTNGIWGAKANI